MDLLVEVLRGEEVIGSAQIGRETVLSSLDPLYQTAVAAYPAVTETTVGGNVVRVSEVASSVLQNATLKSACAARVAELKQDGNDAISYDPRGAGRCYRDALKLAENAIKLDATESGKGEGGDAFSAIRPSLLLNLAFSYLKRDKPRKALVHLGVLLQEQPGHEKGLYRKGLAHMALGDNEAALQSFVLCGKSNPANKEAANKAGLCRTAIEAEKVQAKGVYSKMF